MSAAVFSAPGWMYLHVWKSNQHLYAQVLHPFSGQVVLSLSTLDPWVRERCVHTNTKEAAQVLGQQFEILARQAGLCRLQLWKTRQQKGFYHGRIQAFLRAIHLPIQ